MGKTHACTDPHHHVHDAAGFVAAVERACNERGLRLTAIRARVLGLVAQAGRPIKAYDLLEQIRLDNSREGEGAGAAAPPTVYRALEFLVEQGILHRVEALNGYVVCRHLDCAHPSVILTCRDCGKVDEMAANEGFMALRQLCAGHGFEMDEQQLLLNGRCVQCSEQIKKS